MTARSGSRDPVRRAENAALVAVPLLLFAIDGLSRVIRGETTEYLLVPPLAVMVYLLFADPGHGDARPRAVVVLPFLAAIAGEVGYAVLGLTPWGVAGVVLVVLLAQRALHARMPPALAIAVLAMLLRVRGPWYPLDIAVASALVWLSFIGWRRLSRLERTARGPHREPGPDGTAPRRRGSASSFLVRDRGP